MSAQLIAGGLFVCVYALIVTDRIHRTLAALLGASLMIILRVVDQSEAFTYVDFNVIFLLAGMMIIANITAKTGIFQWIAVEAVRRARGSPYALLVLTSIVTAVVSAFLDNVTTVVLLTPVIFFIAQRLGTSPVPFLISQVIASNIGGTATLIGDPPNIIIGSRLGKDFTDFLMNVGPAAAAALAVYLLLARWLFRADLRQASAALEAEDIQRLVEEERRIEDSHLMRVSGIVIAFTILGFLLSRAFGLQGATIAMTGAVVLMIVAREDVHEILKTVEYIPYTVTMVPLIQQLGHSVDVEPLIWALSLGANLGGNATVVGASANVVVASMSEARGHPISFVTYLRYGVPATLATMIVGTIDIWLRYLLFT